MSFRSSADGIAKKGKTKGKCVSMPGNQIGGPSGGAFTQIPKYKPKGQ